MVSLDKFKAVDSSFRVHSSKENDGLVATLCSLDCFHDKGVIFIKNKKYYRRLLEQLERGNIVETIGVIFKSSFLKEINGGDESKILNQFRFYATVESVDLALSVFSKLFFDEFNKNGNDSIDGRKTGSARVHPTSFVAQDVFIGEGVEIAANVTIHSGCVILSNSTIGERTTLYPNVVICRNVSMGQDCIVHANTTIGSDGFSYNYHQGSHLKVWHFGGVVIGDSVEIGSNTSIDQGTFSPTVIGKGSKIDNQVHIAHNCRLGNGVIVCGQTGLAGSVTVGDYVVIGGAANLAPDIKIGNNAQIGGMAGVTSDVPERGVFGGHPARPIHEWLRSSATLRRMSLSKYGKDRDIPKRDRFTKSK